MCLRISSLIIDTITIIKKQLGYLVPCSNKFITIIGLITSNRSPASNIMVCDWTHHLS